MLDNKQLPIQQLLRLIAKIPGMADSVNPLIEKMQNFRKGLGVNVTTNAAGETLNNDGSVAKAPKFDVTNNLNSFSGNAPLLNQKNNSATPQNNSKLDVFINNRAGGTETFTEGTGVNVESTGY